MSLTRYSAVPLFLKSVLIVSHNHCFDPKVPLSTTGPPVSKGPTRNLNGDFPISREIRDSGAGYIEVSVEAHSLYTSYKI